MSKTSPLRETWWSHIWTHICKYIHEEFIWLQTQSCPTRPVCMNRGNAFNHLLNWQIQRLNNCWNVICFANMEQDSLLPPLQKRGIRKISKRQYPAGMVWWMIHKWLTRIGEELLIILMPLVKNEYLAHGDVNFCPDRQRGVEGRYWI